MYLSGTYPKAGRSGEIVEYLILHVIILRHGYIEFKMQTCNDDYNSAQLFR